MLRSAPALAAWCAAKPGPIQQQYCAGRVPALQCTVEVTLHRVRDTVAFEASLVFAALHNDISLTPGNMLYSRIDFTADDQIISSSPF
jgi:hypothetical protein